MSSSPFRIALTADFYDDAGRLHYADVGLDRLSSIPRIDVARLDRHLPEVAPEQLSGVNGVIVLSSRITARTLSNPDDLLAVARFGVGYDSVDVPACTAADVVLCIAAGAVDYSVAEATVGWLLALTHHMHTKDRLVRESRWRDRSRFMGSELRERTLGLVGFGGIGRAVVRLLSGFGMQLPLVYDPYLSDDAVASCGCRAVSLDELLSHSDFVSLHCPLTDGTRNLIGARELALMRPTAYLINTARGGIVNEPALLEALSSRRIAGAALDCFVEEPPSGPSPFADLDNVLLAPHSIAWSNELFRDIGRTACQSLADLAQGRRPHGVVNPEVFDRPGFQAKWRRLRLD
jgi:phosphoglycerate dehydrogenase-like enzyme